LGVERFTIQTIEIVYFQVSVVKEDDMSGILPGNAFTDGAVASVDVDRVVIGMSVNVIAPAGIFMRHGLLPLIVRIRYQMTPTH
ncbi:MAG: hypothetical protein IH840_04550, partial [Candidatus Heimdallarchaeota archaeon]|nr:hypothetical protein [Candidatus Heimdallarchaeota archaeon]